MNFSDILKYEPNLKKGTNWNEFFWNFEISILSYKKEKHGIFWFLCIFWISKYLIRLKREKSDFFQSLFGFSKDRIKLNETKKNEKSENQKNPER